MPVEAKVSPNTTGLNAAPVQAVDGAVSVPAGSNVALNVAPDAVAGYGREGADLLVHLKSGELVRIANFYLDPSKVSHLLLVNENGLVSAEVGQVATGAISSATYVPIDAVAGFSAPAVGAGSVSAGAAAGAVTAGGGALGAGTLVPLAVLGGGGLAAAAASVGGGRDEPAAPPPGGCRALNATMDATYPLRSQDHDPLREGLVLLAAMLGRHTSVSELGDGLPLVDGQLAAEMVPRAMRRLEIAAQVRRSDLIVPRYLLPALLILDDGDCVVLSAIEGDTATLRLPCADGGLQKMPINELAAIHSGMTVFAKARFRSDERAGALAATTGQHWFFGALRRYRNAYFEVALGAMMANLLAIASALFAMQVYDRVVPTAAFDTLWLLASGVALAIVFEALLRHMRGHLLDTMGKSLDLTLSTQLFARVLQTRLSARPASLGAFTSQIREFEGVREFFTSSSAAIASDLPFTLIFLSVIALVGGWIVVVPIVGIMLMVLPSLVMQRRLAELSRRNLHEGAIKNSILIEAVENLEAIKAGRGEGRAMMLWEALTAQLAETAKRTHSLGSTLTYGAAMVQQLCYVGVVAFGVYRISEGAMTVGALVACSLLAARRTRHRADDAGRRYPGALAAHPRRAGGVGPVDGRPGRAARQPRLRPRRTPARPVRGAGSRHALRR
jgi:ATP-binding cassette subfamily C protein LapB